MNSKVLLFPLKIVLAFLVFSELLIWLGPTDYDIKNNLTLAFFLLVVNLAFYWGYKIGIRKKRKESAPVPLIYVKVLIVVGVFLTIHNLYWMWAYRGIDVTLSNLILSLSNPGDAYFSEAETVARETPFHLFMAPFKFAAIPCGIYAWKRLPKLYRILVILTCLIEAFAWMGVGTRKGLFDIVVISLFTIIAGNPDIINSDSRYRKFKIISISFILVFLVYFSFSGLTRAGGQEFSDFVSVANRYGIKPFYKENLPIWLYYPVASIDSYLCQGYYALSKGLEIGIKPLTFMGQSWFTINFSINHFGYNPLPDTYMQDLSSFGIDPWVNWHTIYLWLANDFSFIGVPFIIMLIGFFFARTWSDVVSGRTFIAVPIFSLFLVMAFYFYANNQVISFQFFSFAFWFVVWVCLRNLKATKQ